MTDTRSLASQLRDNINSRLKREVAKNLSTTEELLQVQDWIEMPEYFAQAVGGKGFPCGHITQIVGDSDTGKTTLLMTAMVETQRSGGIVYLIDSEHKFDFNRLRMMGGVPEEIVTMSVESLEEAWGAMNAALAEIQAVREKHPDTKMLLAWDSLAASVPDAMLEAEAEDQHVAVEAKINNKEIRKMRQRVKRANVAAVFINHTYWTMPKFGISKEVLKGGSEMFFMSTLILKTKRRGWLEREVNGLSQRYGTQSFLEVFKGHLGGRKTTTPFFIVDRGILSNERELDEYKQALSKERSDAKAPKKSAKSKEGGV